MHDINKTGWWVLFAFLFFWLFSFPFCFFCTGQPAQVIKVITNMGLIPINRIIDWMTLAQHINCQRCSRQNLGTNTFAFIAGFAYLNSFTGNRIGWAPSTRLWRPLRKSLKQIMKPHRKVMALVYPKVFLCSHDSD
ncbi:MAG: hypothetical protein CM1200mP39_23510 [Dehalococcoidia bacterium]|nr:MAG: hypothetical protein CM1200mP39_23510 [Dehalococcoidia bacterium]